MKRLILSILLAVGLQPAFAGEATPAFMQPEVLKAAAAINLTDEQKPQFQAALTTFFNERIKAINTLMRRNNQSGVPRKIKSRTNSLLKKMDKEMAAFLSEEQLPAYQTYRDALKANLRGM